MKDDIKPLSSESLAESSHNSTGAEEEPMPKRSRLKKTLENNSKRTMLISLVGIFAIVVVIGIFGIPFLEHFARLTSRDDKSEASNAEEEAIVLLPPFLHSPHEATNSAEIDLSGTSEEGEKVKLYRDGKLVKEAKIDSDNAFTFTGIELQEGANQFTAKVIKDKHESRSSDTVRVTYRKEAPKVTIDYPGEGQGISNKDGDRLQIEGTTEPNMNVTINGFQAIVDDEGKFKYTLSIKGGENTIKAVATDEAGNKTEMERKFTYNP